MSEAPERIWIEDEFGEGDEDQWSYGTWDVRNYAGYNVEYVRADIVQALTAELASADAMIEAQAKDHASNNIRFAEATHRAEAAEAKRDRLREALGLDPWFVGRDAWKKYVNIALNGDTP